MPWCSTFACALWPVSLRESTNLKYHTTQRLADGEAVRIVHSVSSFCLGETTADPSPAREADSLPYNGDRAFLRSRNRKREKGANLSGYTTQRLADVEAGRIVLSVSSFCQHKITADPSVFSFFPEIFLFLHSQPNEAGVSGRGGAAE